jgi:hypothetical protein
MKEFHLVDENFHLTDDRFSSTRRSTIILKMSADRP